MMFRAGVDNGVSIERRKLMLRGGLLVGAVAGAWGLGAAWGRQKALEMLHAAGFGHVRVERLEHDAQNYYYIARHKVSGG